VSIVDQSNAGLAEQTLATRGIRAMAVAVGIVLALVAAGVLLSIGITLAAKSLLPPGSVDLAKVALAAKVLGDLFSLALFFQVIRWIAGRDMLVWLLGPGPPLPAAAWIGIILALYVVKALSVLAGGWLDGPKDGAIEALRPVAQAMSGSAWPLLMLAGIVAAIVEEVLFRGYLSRVLEQTRLGFWGGAALASLVWALLHTYYPLGMQASLIVLGVALSYIRARTGSMYPGMAWHVVNNAVALIALRSL
jgi:membrane protease YdiL (CAAX protease family)